MFNMIGGQQIYGDWVRDSLIEQLNLSSCYTFQWMVDQINDNHSGIGGSNFEVISKISVGITIVRVAKVILPRDQQAICLIAAVIWLLLEWSWEEYRCGGRCGCGSRRAGKYREWEINCGY